MSKFDGIRVVTADGYKGTVEGEPLFTPSGEVVTIIVDNSFISPSGRIDVLLSSLTREDNGARLEDEPALGLNGGLYKAEAFEDFATARGWSALARKSPQYGTALVTARKGNVQLTLVWREGRFSYASSSIKTVDEAGNVRTRKLRNASAYRKAAQAQL